MTPEDIINKKIQQSVEIGMCDTNKISDWYHTFWELYKHRIYLFIALCRKYKAYVLKSKKHNDWTSYKWWFILQMYLEEVWQISYHLPTEYWDLCDFEEFEIAMKWDWHTSEDVLERLLKL